MVVIDIARNLVNSPAPPVPSRPRRKRSARDLDGSGDPGSEGGKRRRTRAAAHAPVAVLERRSPTAEPLETTTRGASPSAGRTGLE